MLIQKHLEKRALYNIFFLATSLTNKDSQDRTVREAVEIIQTEQVRRTEWSEYDWKDRTAVTG